MSFIKNVTGTKTAGNFSNVFDGIFSLDVLVSEVGCHFKYLMVAMASPRVTRYKTLNNRNYG